MQKIKYIIGFWTMGFIFFGYAWSQIPVRSVFASGGGEGNVGLYYYAYTIGEPMIGTDFSSTPILTKGFHQHKNFNILSAETPQLSIIQEEQNALLRWDLPENSYVRAFRIERKDSFGNFEEIGFQKLTYPNTQSLSFTFLDRDIYKHGLDNLYYRLVWDMPNGNLGTSNVVELVLSKISQMRLHMYPNPAHKRLNLEILVSKKGPYQVRVLDLLGRTMFHKQMALQVGTNRNELDISNFSPGLYLVTIHSNRGGQVHKNLEIY